MAALFLQPKAEAGICTKALSKEKRGCSKIWAQDQPFKSAICNRSQRAMKAKSSYFQQGINNNQKVFCLLVCPARDSRCAGANPVKHQWKLIHPCSQPVRGGCQFRARAVGKSPGADGEGKILPRCSVPLSSTAPLLPAALQAWGMPGPRRVPQEGAFLCGFPGEISFLAC